MHLVVENEVVIALAPGIANAFVAVDDQGVETEAAQAGADAEAGLAAADNQHGRFVVFVCALAIAGVEPVFGAKAAGPLFAGRPVRVDAFFMACNLIERRQHDPAAQLPGFIGTETHDAAALANCGLEGDNRLDGFDACAHDDRRRCAAIGDREVARAEFGQRPRQKIPDTAATIHGINVPGEREEITPVAVIEK